MRRLRSSSGACRALSPRARRAAGGSCASSSSAARAVRRGPSSPRKPSARSDRRVPAAPPSRLVSEGGSRISTSALQERERALDVHAEGPDRAERGAPERAARAVPVLPLGEVLLDGEGIRGPLLRTTRRTRGEPLLVQLGIGADHLDEAGLDLATLRKLDPLLTGGGHGVHGVDDDAA